MSDNTHGLPAVQESGFSIVEMMISITIGMVIVLFISSLFVSSKSSSQMSDDNARLQEDGRLAMTLLGRNLTQAGYGEPIGFASRQIVTAFNGQGFHACDGGYATPEDLSSNACANSVNGGTAFQVSYQVEQFNGNTGAGADCNGQAAPNGIALNRFFLKTKSGESTQSLYCAGNGNPNAQPLLSNVEAMSLSYGIDTDGDLNPDTFTNSATDALVLSPETVVSRGYKGVVSVTVCLQLVSSGYVAPELQTYRNCNGTMVTSGDRKMHIVLRNVFALRNNSGATLSTYDAAL